MTSKTTTKATSPKATSPKTSRKTTTRTARKKSNRINRQRRLQKQLQILLLERHSRRCIICHHPDREAIEEEFVHWRAPWKLAQDYELADYRTVYRHARAVGLLLQRRERLHSALDAFVESVDDVTFTGDTILRAMRAYSCIDDHGRWTEIPTRVQFSTNHDAHPPQPIPRSPNVGSNGASGLGSRTLDVVPKYSNRASRSDATACAVSPAQALNVTEDEYADEVPEDDAEDAPEERVTAYDVTNIIRKYANQALLSDATTGSASSKSTSPSGATACAGSPAQASNAPEDDYADPEDDDDPEDEPDNDSDDELEEDAEIELEESINALSTSSKSPSRNDGSVSSKSVSRSDTPTCAAPPAQSAAPLTPNHRGRTVTSSACADSPAQALPRDVVRGQNPNDRSPSDRTASAAPPPQPAAPPRPKPDADGFIWHPRPGYPDQEMSEPNAEGRVMYKIHMTTAAPQPPSRQTGAQRAAELIYRSVIKKYGNP